jgi:hypothetical protein
LRAAVTARRVRLFTCGHVPLPCHGKAPVIPAWTDTPIDISTIEGWRKSLPRALNTGVLARRTPGIDIDVYDPAMAETLQQEVLSMLPQPGTVLVREGMPPKRLIPARCDEPFDKVASDKFQSPDGKCHKVEILCDGQQFIVEGVHPDTGKPYQWAENLDLHSVAREHLPLIDATIARRIVERANELMAAAGWKVVKKGKVNGNGKAHAKRDDFDSPHAGLNTLALKCMERWVPDLNLPRCVRRGGRGANYRAVPPWRDTGKPLAERDLALSIHPQGIKDFGDNEKGYSPLDLVMIVKGCDLGAAFDWLSERVRPDTGPVVDWDALAGDVRHDPTPDAPPPGDDAKVAEEDKKILAEAGAWFHGTAPPPPAECSFEGVLPIKGAGLIVAQYGCNKSHILTDLCVAATMPDGPDGPPKWAGRQRTRRVGAVYIEFENSGIPLRVACVCKKRGVEETLPLLGVPTAPPIVIKKRVNPDAIKWYRKVLGAAHREFMRRFGVPLGLLGIDPLVDAADFDNENDNSETNRAMKAFDELGNEFNCVVVVNDHAGKEIARGPRGGSSKPGKAHFVFQLPEKIADRSQHRLMDGQEASRHAGRLGC